MKADNPIVSVIVPVYNTEKYLEECLESILNQTLSDIEIICIDDKSTDNSLQILKEYSKKDERIIIMENDSNRGLSFNRNKGMAHAKGKYVSFIDADDKIDVDAYEKLYNFIEENNQDFIIFNAIRFTDYGRKYDSELHKIAISDKPITSTNILKNREFVFDTGAWNKFINKDFLLNSKIKFKEGRFYEDLLFSMELFCASDSIGVLPDVYYYWRIRKDDENKSITQEYSNIENIKDRLYIINEINELLDDSKYSSLIDSYNKKLLKIDYRHIVNQLSSDNSEIINLVEKQVKPKIAKMDESLFDDLDGNLKIKYDLLINGDIENIVYLREFEVDAKNRIKELRKENASVRNQNNILKKENKEISKKNKNLKKSNKKLKNEIKVIKSTKGWFNYKIRNIFNRIFKR